MTVQEFKDKYPYLCIGLSDEEIKEMIGPEPEPDKYYFDAIIGDCHYACSWVNIYSFDTAIRLMHN